MYQAAKPVVDKGHLPTLTFGRKPE